MANALDAELQTLQSLLHRQYDTIEALRTAVLNEVVLRGLSYKPTHSDKKRWFLVCKGKAAWSCPFELRATASDGGFIIRKVIDHTCPSTVHDGWRQAQKTTSIASRHRTTVESFRDTKPAQIRAAERSQYGNTTSYKQAWRARHHILQQHEGQEGAGFARLPHLLERADACGTLNEGNCAYTIETTGSEPRLISDFHSAPRDPAQIVPPHTFLAYFACPHVCQQAYREMRKVIMVDGCHLKGPYKLILLVAVGLDGEGNILPIAWGVVWAENKDNWRAFLDFLINSLKKTHDRRLRSTIFVTDRQKGLIPALEEGFIDGKPRHFFCIHHISGNIAEEYGQGARKLFMSLAYATTKEAFRQILDKIDKEGAGGLKDYIEKIPAERWARCFVEHHRFGQFTSNLAESINSVWLEQRELPILQCFQAIWHYIMDTCFKRREEASFVNPRWTNWAWNVY